MESETRIEDGAILAVFFSIIAIICCIVAFYLYLQRLELPHIADDSWQDEAPPIPETKVISTTLPFSLAFNDRPSGTASMKDGVRITLEASVPCILQGFWVVECAGLTDILRSCDRSGDRSADKSGDIDLEGGLQDISQSHTDKHFLDSHTTKDITLQIANTGLNIGRHKQRTFDLGPTPRSQYPLVLLVSRCEGNSETESPAVASILWIVHLPDQSVTSPLHLISQVLVTDQGQVCDLQKMFLASDVTRFGDHRRVAAEHHTTANTTHSNSSSPENCDNSYSTGSANHPNSDISDDLDVTKGCIICQNAAISRVILPCRHACVCEHCLGLVSACPMCRGAIVSHFKMDADECAINGEGQRSKDMSMVEGNNDWTMRIQDMMERLNEWLGFT